MSDKLDKDAREAFVAKFRSLRQDTAKFYPSSPSPEDWGDEIDHEQLLKVKERLVLTFRRFGFEDGVEEITKLFDSEREHLLWIAEDPPWRQGEYGMVTTILSVIDSYLFA